MQHGALMRRWSPIAAGGFGVVMAVAVACTTQTTSPSPLPSLPPLELGAGFRYSTYGPSIDPGPPYWLRVGREMASRFDGARPQAIWIVSTFTGVGTKFTFPGVSEDPTIHFSMEDNNEAALDLFDAEGVDVWLQVEPGAAPMEEVIDIVMDRYGSHRSVIGFGVDVEWFESGGDPEGVPVTDAQARAWLAAIRAHDPDDRLFLKHWEIDWMPPTERDGIVFINDSQGHASFDAMMADFSAWGEAFAPAQVGYQYGYTADQGWWGEMADPSREIGQGILDRVPNAVGLYWVDFTVLEVFEP
jgi:hypothetical protein